jgi:hypothetical protein
MGYTSYMFLAVFYFKLIFEKLSQREVKMDWDNFNFFLLPW